MQSEHDSTGEYCWIRRNARLPGVQQNHLFLVTVLVPRVSFPDLYSICITHDDPYLPVEAKASRQILVIPRALIALLATANRGCNVQRQI